MRRLAAGVLAGTLSCALLVGCGEDDPFAGYCDQVQTEQKAITEAAAQGGPAALLEALPSFERLQDRAPDDIADEWAIVVQRLADLRDAFDEADVDPAAYDAEDPPAGLSKEEERAIASAAGALATPEMTAALDGVQQQARDVCKTPLSV